MNFDDFDKITAVEVSPFLFAKIQHKIAQTATIVMPVKWVWGLAGALVLIMVLNFSAMTLSTHRDSDADQFAASMHLSPNNNLYR